MALKINLSEAQIDLIKIIINIYKKRVCIYMLLAAGQDS